MNEAGGSDGMGGDGGMSGESGSCTAAVAASSDRGGCTAAMAEAAAAAAARAETERTRATVARAVERGWSRDREDSCMVSTSRDLAMSVNWPPRELSACVAVIPASPAYLQA
jgi:hypothetical protein